MEVAEQDASGQAGGTAVGLMLDVVHLTRRSGLAAPAGPFAVPGPEADRLAEAVDAIGKGS